MNFNHQLDFVHLVLLSFYVFIVIFFPALYGGLALALCQVPPKLLHHTPPHPARGQKKYHERLLGQDKDRKGSLTHQLFSWVKQTRLGEIN